MPPQFSVNLEVWMNLVCKELRSRAERLERENLVLRLIVIAFLVCWVVLNIDVGAKVKAQGKRETMNFGGQEFSIGMPKEQALSKLALCCRISGFGNGYFIESKAEPIEIIGRIFFEGGRVSLIQRDVNYFSEDEAINLGQTVYRLLAKISESTPQRVLLETNSTELRNGTLREVTLTFSSGKGVAIRVNKVDASSGMRDSVDVSESLSVR
jgi:hypothetical protein